MSQFYGLLAGLCVCLATWAATVYVSELAGLLVGLFLLTFFAVSTIYLTGDELIERQKAFARALVDLEGHVLARLKEMEQKISHVSTIAPTDAPLAADARPNVQALNALLKTLDGILDNAPGSETARHVNNRGT